MLYGPRSKSDLLLEYAIRNGKLRVPKGAIWDPSSWYDANETAFNELVRGMFNPRRYVAAPKRPPLVDRWNVEPDTRRGLGDFAAWNNMSTVNAGGSIAKISGA